MRLLALVFGLLASSWAWAAACSGLVNPYMVSSVFISSGGTGVTADAACADERNKLAVYSPTSTWTVSDVSEYTCRIKRVASGVTSYYNEPIHLVCGNGDRDGFGTSADQVNALITASGGGGGGGTTTYVVENDLFNIDAAGGASLTAAILLAWAAGFGVRVVIQALRG